jgi:hypothetical protein
LQAVFVSYRCPHRDWRTFDHQGAVRALPAHVNGDDLQAFLGSNRGENDDAAARRRPEESRRDVALLELFMGCCPFLHHAPRGRDEREAWQLARRRHDGNEV